MRKERRAVGGFDRVSDWPSRSEAEFGVSSGWEGYAWSWLQSAAAGITPPRPAVLAQIERRVSRGLRDAPSAYCSGLFGSGAQALVARLLQGFDRRFEPLARQALRAWEISCERSEHFDLMLGRAGALVACAELETAFPGAVPKRLSRFLFEHTLARMRMFTRFTEGVIYNGLMHGLAGYLLALESGRAAFGLEARDGLDRRCRELLYRGCRRGPKGSYIWHALTLGYGDDMLGSVCRGAPGILLALMTCRRLSGNKDYAAPIERAARAAQVLSTFNATYCCGSVGRAQVLLETYRFTGERLWLSRARRVRHEALPADAEKLESRGGLFYGRLGALYLDLRLRFPDLLPLPGLGVFSAPAAWKK